MPTAFGYGRVTSRRQADSGVGEATQKATIDRGFRLAEFRQPGIAWGGHFFDKGVSGEKVYFPERPEGARLLALARPGDTLIVTHSDRLARRPFDWERLVEFFRERQIGLYIVELDVDPFSLGGGIVLSVLAHIARCEVVRIRDRANERIKAQREAGQWAGGKIPYGFVMVRDKLGRPFLVPNARERAVGSAILSWRLAGHSSAAIARHLNAKGCSRNTGSPGDGRTYRADGQWTENSVNHIIRYERAVANEEQRAGVDNATSFYVPHRGRVRARDFPEDIRRHLPTPKTVTTDIATLT